jgi:signal transduction histidine kinase/CheY-like chemotaxis protein
MGRLDHKVLLASLSLGLLLAACYGLVLREVRDWRGASAELVRGHHRAQGEGVLHEALTRATGELASFVQTGREAYAQEAAEALERARQAAGQLKALADAGPSAVTSDDASLLERQLQLLSLTERTEAAVRQRLADGAAADRTALLDQVYAHEEGADALVREVAERRGAERDALERAVAEHGRRTVAMVWLSGLALLVWIGVLVAFTRRRVVAPLDRLAEATAAVAAGDLARRVDVTHGDEIGRLQRHFNTMVAALAGQRSAMTALVAELSAARDEAQAASRAQSDFLAHVSHEIRTPMNAVVVGTDLLAEPADDAAQRRELADVTRVAVRQLRTQLANLLDHAGAASARPALRHDAVELEPVLRQATALYAAAAAAKGLAFAVHWRTALPGTVLTDAQALAQVLMNLLDNAVKFTERGSIDVSVTVEPAARPLDAARLVVDVADTGIGMSAEVLQRIFEPFYRAEAPALSPSGGFGLGLGLAHELVQALQGTLVARSSPGAGSTFRLELPLETGDATPDATPDADTPAARAVPAEPGDAPAVVLPHGRTILLADDNRDTRYVVTRMLESRGLVVAGAADGVEAVALATGRDIDVVLMDCNMPGMNGFEATAAIRALPGPRSMVPIVALTAYGLHDDRRRYLEAGFDDLVAKPYSVEEIEAVLYRWLVESPRPAGGRAG